MFSVNHIAGFLKLFLQNKLIKNLLVGRGQKWVWQIWSWNSENWRYLKNEQTEKTTFCSTDSQKLKAEIFGWAHSKASVASLVTGR